MAAFVVDASAALPWCFGDEATDWTKALLSRVRAATKFWFRLTGLSKLRTLFSLPATSNVFRDRMQLISSMI